MADGRFKEFYSITVLWVLKGCEETCWTKGCESFFLFFSFFQALCLIGACLDMTVPFRCPIQIAVVFDS